MLINIIAYVRGDRYFFWFMSLVHTEIADMHERTQTLNVYQCNIPPANCLISEIIYVQHD